MRRVAFAILALFLAASAGHAQPKKPSLAPLPDPLHILQPLADQTNAGGNDIANALAKPFTDLANLIGEDSDAAIALSTAIPSLQDGNGQVCWMAAKQFAAVIKAHPVPLTLKLETDIEALRLLTMAANNLCTNAACTVVFSDLAATAQQAAPANFSIGIPSLHDICTHVPSIQQAPPASPTATPVPAPAPAAK